MVLSFFAISSINLYNATMAQVRRHSYTCVCLVAMVLLLPSAARADAIMPSLVLIWPITIFLFIPIIILEALYSKSRLGFRLWESIRVTGIANLLSSIAGLPIATLASEGLKYILEAVYFRDLNKLHEKAAQLGATEPHGLKAHDYFNLVFLGLYPRWILLVCALAMLLICFVVSWWIEAQWVQRHIKRSMNATPLEIKTASRVIRNANLLSYAFVTVISIWLLASLWPRDVLSQ